MLYKTTIKTVRLNSVSARLPHYKSSKLQSSSHHASVGTHTMGSPTSLHTLQPSGELVHHSLPIPFLLSFPHTFYPFTIPSTSSLSLFFLNLIPHTPCLTPSNPQTVPFAHHALHLHPLFQFSHVSSYTSVASPDVAIATSGEAAAAPKMRGPPSSMAMASYTPPVASVQEVQLTTRLSLGSLL